MNLSELGQRIRMRRERRGLRQADLSAALRVTPQAVSKWERGDNAPDISVLVRLAQLLDVSVEWLLDGGQAERETFEAVVFVTAMEGYAARAAEQPPRAMAAWANGIHATVTEAILHFDGVPVKYTGDGMLAFFTGAQMHGRALRAAARAGELVDADGFRVALHAGDIYLGQLGHPDYSTRDILGSTVNTAFLMLPHAADLGPRTIAVSEKLAESETEGFRFEAPRSVELAGESAGLALYEAIAI